MAASFERIKQQAHYTGRHSQRNANPRREFMETRITTRGEKSEKRDKKERNGENREK